MQLFHVTPTDRTSHRLKQATDYEITHHDGQCGCLHLVLLVFTQLGGSRKTVAEHNEQDSSEGASPCRSDVLEISLASRRNTKEMRNAGAHSPTED